MTWLIDYGPIILILVGVAGYLWTQYRQNGTLSLEDLAVAVQYAVKAAEIRYIKSGGAIDRYTQAISMIMSMLGIEAMDPETADILDTMIDGAVNDLPKTSERME